MKTGGEAGPPAYIDVDRLIDEGRWSGLQRFVFFAIMIVFLVEGLDNQVMGTVLPALAHDWRQPAHAFATALAFGWAGAGVGTIAGGYFGDRFGRKPALIGSLLLFGLPAIATVFVHDIATLSVLRLIAGMGLGACDPSALALLTEFAPRRRQGRAIASALVVSLIGLGACGLIASLVLPTSGWRAMFLIVGVTPVAWAIVLMFTMAESPRHLAKLPAQRPAFIALLRRLGHTVADDARVLAPEGPVLSPVSALFSRPQLPSTLCLWTGFMFAFLASGAVFSWAPTMMARAGLGMAGAGEATLAQSIGGIFGTMLAGPLTERLGGVRSTQLFALAAAIGAAILMAAMAVHLSHPILLPVLLALEGGLLSGVMTSLFGSAAQIYPSGSRASGIGFAGALGRVGAILSSYAGVWAYEAAGGPGLFAIPLCASGSVLAAMLMLQKKAR